MMMEFLKIKNKTIYVGILAVLTVCLLLDYVPGMSACASWVTPPYEPSCFACIGQGRDDVYDSFRGGHHGNGDAHRTEVAEDEP